MNMKTVLTTGVAALVLNMSLAGAIAPAQARNGGAIAAGVIGGLALGAIVGSAASAQPSYGYEPSYAYGPPPVYEAPAPIYGGDCYVTRHPTYDAYGDFAGYRRVRVCE